MSLRSLLPTLLISSAVAFAACGGEEQAASPSEEQSSPAQALTEIDRVRDSLDQAVAAVEAGDADRADELLADGYVEHFELVEGPLEDVDAELNEELEETLSHGIRAKLKSGASAAEVRRMVEDVKADLDTAEGKLR